MKRIVLRGVRVEARFLNARFEAQKTKKAHSGKQTAVRFKHKKTKVCVGAQKTIRNRVFFKVLHQWFGSSS